MNKEEREFFDICLSLGMEDGTQSLEAALRAFRRWRNRGAVKENDLRNMADYDNPATFKTM